MSSTEMFRQSIFELIQADSSIEHVRLNIINGCDEVFSKYKESLHNQFEGAEDLSIRFYDKWIDVYEDLFFDDKAMNDDWFNLFVFNLNYCTHICDNPDCKNFGKETSGCSRAYECISTLCAEDDEEQISIREQIIQEINGIYYVHHEMQERYDSKYYTSVIVSLIDKDVLSKMYEEITNKPSPIRSMRFLSYNFNQDDVMELLYNIIHTHSTRFLMRWAKAIEKMEKFKDSKIIA